MKPPKEYQVAKDGEWIQPVRRGYLLACCDCGLVHRVNFRIRKGKIQFQAFRHPQATGAYRKKRNITVERSASR